MKKGIIITFIALILLAGTAWGYYQYYDYQSLQDQQASNYRLSRDEVALIQDGDIILRHGYGLVSDMIVERLNENYDLSHCGILCKEKDSIFIIHSVSSSVSPDDGVQTQGLSAFVHDAQKNSIVIIRYKNEGASGSNAGISRRARAYLKQKISFDHSFDLSDSTDFYCTELIWKCIYNEYHDEFFTEHYDQRNDFLRFDLLLDTTKFDIIVNHQIRNTLTDHQFGRVKARNLVFRRKAATENQAKSL